MSANARETLLVLFRNTTNFKYLERKDDNGEEKKAIKTNERKGKMNTKQTVHGIEENYAMLVLFPAGGKQIFK